MESNWGAIKHDLFAVHMLNEEGKRKAGVIAYSFDNLLSILEANCTEGREFSLVKTKLEEACFYAKKSMAINLNNQELQVSA